jgi:hypothetical protein
MLSVCHLWWRDKFWRNQLYLILPYPLESSFYVSPYIRGNFNNRFMINFCIVSMKTTLSTLTWFILRFPQDIHIVGTCNYGTKCIILITCFVVFQLKWMNSRAVSLSLSHTHTHTGYVCYGTVWMCEYLATCHGSLLPPFSWSLQAKIPPEAGFGKLSKHC